MEFVGMKKDVADIIAKHIESLAQSSRPKQ
jgi:hypothetical protein